MAPVDRQDEGWLNGTVILLAPDPQPLIPEHPTP